MGIMKGGSGGGGGEIVQVQGGHIVRATGRKDRHSKVYTSKGPRDRRVRLSAHTAIQFYDVQDRLGFDRPSKAVDWLITKAKPSIDKLAQLPPWNPTTGSSNPNADPDTGGIAAPEHQEPEQCGGGYAGGDNGGTSFMPPSQLDSDTMKLFFPTSSGYPPEILMSRGTQQSEDLGLSLHSFQDTAGQAGLFPGSDPDGFGSTGNYQRIMGWSSTDPAALADNQRGSLPPSSSSSSALSGGFFLINHNSSSSQPLMMIPQRGTLQSSNQFAPPSLGGFDELPIGSVFGRGRFVSDGLTGYGFPGRDAGVPERPPHSSTSPNSDHH